jgi:GNAT superfamily N-acetyltransferase
VPKVDKPQAAEFQIRFADASDERGILDCLGRAFAPYRERYTPQAFADTILDAQAVRRRLSEMSVLVAVSAAGVVIGSVGFTLVDGEEGHLRGMAVRPEHLGGGVAQRLLESAEAALRERGCSRVTLDTTEPLERAMRFYERNGYGRSGVVRDFFGMPLLEYVKPLR